MPESRKSPLIPLVIAAIAAIVLGVTLVPSLMQSDDETGSEASSGSSSTQDRAPADTWEQIVRRGPEDPMALGDADAPVVMVAYSEFQCPFCGKFARDTEPQLVERYVADGTLRIEWRDFPYLGPESMTAALAGRAAAEQDMFWEFHEAMYDDQLPPNSGRLDESYVAAVAEQVGLDVEQFREDMRSDSSRTAVERDLAEGQAIGVTGTPAFVINGIPVIGAQPIPVFEETIEKAAEDAGS